MDCESTSLYHKVRNSYYDKALYGLRRKVCELYTLVLFRLDSFISFKLFFILHPYSRENILKLSYPV
jgi:hypothetical protein